MNARMKQQLGQALLGAVLVVTGVVLRPDEMGNELVRLVSGAVTLCGAVLLLVGLAGLIHDLLKAKDESDE